MHQPETLNVCPQLWQRRYWIGGCVVMALVCVDPQSGFGHLHLLGKAQTRPSGEVSI
jgi:hypothetical protein